MKDFNRKKETGMGTISKKKKKKNQKKNRLFLGQDILWLMMGREQQGFYHVELLFFLWGMETDYLTAAN